MGDWPRCAICGEQPKRCELCGDIRCYCSGCLCEDEDYLAEELDWQEDEPAYFMPNLRNASKVTSPPNVVDMLAKKRGARPWRELAAEIGCSAAYLSDVINGRREPGPKILDFLGLERVLVKKRNKGTTSSMVLPKSVDTHCNTQ